jgi:hypothetical protein
MFDRLYQQEPKSAINNSAPCVGAPTWSRLLGPARMDGDSESRVQLGAPMRQTVGFGVPLP